MAKGWKNRVILHSMTWPELNKHLASLKDEDNQLLDFILTSVIEACPNLEYRAVGGYSPYAFHIKIPGDLKPSVMVAIIPQKRNGIKVRTRRQIGDFGAGKDQELPWERDISNSDIESIISYCRGLK
jgi:hypothetical protein